MHLYIAYASENRAVAEQIYLALVGDGHEVFFDRPSLQAGNDYDRRFREAIAVADALIFLISPSSIRGGCYALTELHYAQKRWPHPRDHVLPVLVEPTNMEAVPPYLSAVTILEPHGNIPAEVADAVRGREKPNTTHEEVASGLHSLRNLAVIVLACIVTAVALGTIFSFAYPHVEIDLSLVVLVLLLAALLVVIARKLWRMLR